MSLKIKLMSLKNFIFNKAKDYQFSVVKINYPDKQVFKLVKKSENYLKESNQKFIQKVQKIDKNRRNNFVFILRNLDFQLWQFPQNWRHRKEKSFFGLTERLIDLFQIENLEKITFSQFQKIISPKESKALAQKRYQKFKSAIMFLKEYDNDFTNYLMTNLKPKNFCLNLFSLKSFQDYDKNLYFLKPNQLLYYEILLNDKTKQNLKEYLNELTIFADDCVMNAFLNLNLISLPKYFLDKIKNKKPIRSKTKLENELRFASIILGEIISEKLQIPSYKLDTILWTIGLKNNFKIPKPRVLTIFY